MLSGQLRILGLLKLRSGREQQAELISEDGQAELKQAKMTNRIDHWEI